MSILGERASDSDGEDQALVFNGGGGRFELFLTEGKGGRGRVKGTRAAGVVVVGAFLNIALDKFNFLNYFFVLNLHFNSCMLASSHEWCMHYLLLLLFLSL